MRDYYKILEVDKSATKEEIKKAYRKLAHKHHPDKKGGDEKKFKDINEAYQVLSSDTKRAQYDQFGTAFEGASGPGGFGGFSSGGGFSGSWDIGDIFEQFFGGEAGRPFGGGAARAKTAQRGEDIYIDAILTLEEVFGGVERSIQLKKFVQCA